MASEDKPRSPIKDVGWLALFLIAIGVIWFAQGGPKRLASTSSPFLKTSEIKTSSPQSSKNNGGQNSASENSKAQTSESLDKSQYADKAVLRAYAARETDPNREYVEIIAASKTDPLPITNWTLEGWQGLDIAIGEGTYLAYSAQVNPQEPIYLEQNSRAIIITGRSPIGTNFRVNICMGYFNQFQKFIPYLSEECPRVSAEDVPQNYPQACYDFVRRLSRCRMPISVPFEAGNDCVQFVDERANYNACVNNYKKDSNFYKKEWRIYLGRDKELWQQRDTIILRDQEGKIIDKVSF